MSSLLCSTRCLYDGVGYYGSAFIRLILNLVAFNKTVITYCRRCMSAVPYLSRVYVWSGSVRAIFCAVRIGAF